MKSFYLESDIEEIYNRLKDHRKLIDNKSFLIVGGNGFLGQYFQAVLQKFNNVKIFVIDKEKPKLELPNTIYLVADIVEFDLETASDYLNVHIDYILAGASLASPKTYKQQPINTLRVGFIGLQNCLDLAQERGAKLLFFSSSEVYQSATQIPTPETYVGAIPSFGERSCYDVSKLVGETLVYYYVQKNGVYATTVLPFNFWGPAVIRDGRVMSTFMTQLVNRKSLEVFDGGNRTRCYSYITDGIVGCLLVLLLGKAGEKYNIGNPETEISVAELADKIIDITKVNTNKTFVHYPQEYAGGNDPVRRVPDITKAKNELGFNPQVSLEEGIKRFYQWALINYKD